MGYSWNDFKEDASSTLKKSNPFGEGGFLNSDNLTVDKEKEGSKKSGLDGKIERQQAKVRARDQAEFDKFNSQDFLDQDELYTPSYLSSPKLKKEQEAMLSLFNSRKDQILSQRATPGIAQTRF